MSVCVFCINARISASWMCSRVASALAFACATTFGFSASRICFSVLPISLTSFEFELIPETRFERNQHFNTEIILECFIEIYGT